MKKKRGGIRFDEMFNVPQSGAVNARRAAR
jgi:hypothetical protein